MRWRDSPKRSISRSGSDRPALANVHSDDFEESAILGLKDAPDWDFISSTSPERRGKQVLRFRRNFRQVACNPNI